MPLACGGVFECLAEDRRLSRNGLPLHVERAVAALVGGDGVVLFARRQKLHVALAGYVAPRIGQPAAYGLARRHGIRRDCERICYAHALRCGYGCVVGGRGYNLRNVFEVCLLAAAVFDAVCRLLYGPALRVDTEEVARGGMEVVPRAVDNHTLQRPRSLPCAHLRGRKVGYVAAYVFGDLLLRGAEIDSQTLPQIILPTVCGCFGRHVGLCGCYGAAGRREEYGRRGDEISRIEGVAHGMWC